MAESPKEAGHVGEAGEYNHEVKNLVATAKNIKGPGKPLLRNLSSMRPTIFVKQGYLPSWRKFLLLRD